MPTHLDHHVPYADAPRTRGRTGVPVLWIAIAAILAVLLWIVLRS